MPSKGHVFNKRRGFLLNKRLIFKAFRRLVLCRARVFRHGHGRSTSIVQFREVVMVNYIKISFFNLYSEGFLVRTMALVFVFKLILRILIV
jgi:hypothetical protein